MSKKRNKIYQTKVIKPRKLPISDPLARNNRELPGSGPPVFEHKAYLPKPKSNQPSCSGNEGRGFLNQKSRWLPAALTLRELRAAAGSVESVLFPLFLSGVLGQQLILTKRAVDRPIVQFQRAGNPQLASLRLPG